MMKIGLILIMIQQFVYSETTETTITKISSTNQICSCEQLQNEKECISLNCTWKGSMCVKLEKLIQIEAYCDLIQKKNKKCNMIEGCALVQEKCVSFAGCTLFFYQSSEQCQNISDRCISDGNQCIDINDCKSYRNQISCQKDQNEIYCFWNTQKLVCEYPTTCEQLPIILNTDEQCRKQLKTCTTKEGGGCETSQEKCENQKLQESCITNLDQTKQCIWDENKCKEKICVNAPTTYNSHQVCNQYLINCTVNDGQNGCQDIPELCTQLKTSYNCIVDITAKICYWNKNTKKCEDKNCENAPDEYQNNDQCQSWLPNCTVKSSGIGCFIKVSDCTQYTAENQCIQTINNELCFWYQNKCQLKTCDNAPNIYINHEQCQLFLSTCTVQQDLTGCESKKTSCSNYQKIEQCVSIMDGSLCVFQDKYCIPRICSNASKELKTNQECQQFSSTCIIKPDQQGCILNECQNITTQDLCKKDFENQECYFGQRCELRTCENASDSYKSDYECREYLSQCTVDDDLQGCKIRPLNCQDLKFEEQCHELTNGIKCSWNDDDQNNKFCRVINCSDIHPNSQTDETCSQFDKNCTVSENPSLCMQKPTSCENILSKDHCFAIVLADQVSKCSWNDESQNCRSRVCQDANVIFITEENCRSYMSTCTVNDQIGCIQEPTTCQGYKKPELCTKLITDPNNIILCGWQGCEDRNCYNAQELNKEYYTHTICNNYLNGCTLNDDQTNCVPQFLSCESIKNQIQCNDTILLDKTRCTYDFSVEPFICRSFQCADNTSSNMTHSLCVELGTQCTLGIQRVGCVQMFKSCAAISTQVQCDETILENNQRCFWDASLNPSVCKDRICSFGYNKTNSQECEEFMSTCTKGRKDQNCIQKPAQCNGLSEEICNNVKLQNGGLCSFDKTIIDTNKKCQNRTCADAPTFYSTDVLCRMWLPTCTVKTNQQGCINEPSDCSQMMKEQCFYIKSSGVNCFWNANVEYSSCRAAECTDANKMKLSTDTQCRNFKLGCTAGKDGGCIIQPTSCYGLEQEHCSKVTINAIGKSESDNKCSWNINKQFCQDRVCSDAPLKFTSESECRNWLKSCTIGLSNKGCINEYVQCDQVQTRNQCRELSNGQKCGWNLGCVHRQCQNAPDTLKTDQECRNYLQECTVQSDGTGCELRKLSCDEINVEIQCYQINDNNKCQWNNDKKQCEVRTCQNSPQTMTQHEKCQDYLQNCTVSKDGKGCDNKMNKCEMYKSISQCIVTLEGRKCQWAEQSCVDILSSCLFYLQKSECTIQNDNQLCIWIDGSCYNRQCKHAPKSYSTHLQCQNYDKNCTTNGTGCMNYKKCSEYKLASSCKKGNDGDCTLVNQCLRITCESAPINLKTDSECSKFLKKCTTNGSGCIEKRRCQDVYIEEGCKYNSQDGICVWLNDQCYDKTCETAHISINTEAACQEYYPNGNCTTKLGGGCIQKSKCKDVQIKQACTTQYDGLKCSWQNDICSLPKSCSNLLGNNHQICNDQQQDCTSDGKLCIPMQTCSNTLNSISCVQGTDGPCLWSNQQCYRYTKCTDLNFSTHQECNKIHSQCTTNGNNCISINSCVNTLKIACYVGIKNLSKIQCIWTPLSNKQSAVQSCIEFTKCIDAYYLNHNDCYNYSQGKCTTDGINGCISLDSCEQYNQKISCVINKQGKIIDTFGNIISTEFCYWNNNKCIAQGCSQLKGITHQQCNSQLITCTSNGFNCILQSTCSKFTTYDSCIAATGNDGKCKWVNNLCNGMKCSDYPATQCSLFSNNCIKNGLNCIEISICSVYKTETACDRGINDSVCIWVNTNENQNECVEITSCSIAKNQKTICNKLSDRCYWQSITTKNQTSYDCVNKTCEIQTDSTCTGFYDWDKNIYTICILDNQKNCVTADPSTLTQQDCLNKTLYQYTWNPQSNKCQICNSKIKQNNSTTKNETENKTILSTFLLTALITNLWLYI